MDSDPADISFVSGADLETAYWALLELVRDDECLFNRASNVRAAIETIGGDYHRHDANSLWHFSIWPQLHVLFGETPADWQESGMTLLNYRLSMPAADLAKVVTLIGSGIGRG